MRSHIKKRIESCLEESFPVEAVLDSSNSEKAVTSRTTSPSTNLAPSSVFRRLSRDLSSELSESADDDGEMHVTIVLIIFPPPPPSKPNSGSFDASVSSSPNRAGDFTLSDEMIDEGSLGGDEGEMRVS